jgi:hypothetical protein
MYILLILDIGRTSLESLYDIEDLGVHFSSKPIFDVHVCEKIERAYSVKQCYFSFDFSVSVLHNCPF